MKKLKLLSWKVSVCRKERVLFSSSPQKTCCFFRQVTEEEYLVGKSLFKTKTRIRNICPFQEKQKIFNLMLNIFLLTQLVLVIKFCYLSHRKLSGPIHNCQYYASICLFLLGCSSQSNRFYLVLSSKYYTESKTQCQVWQAIP